MKEKIINKNNSIIFAWLVRPYVLYEGKWQPSTIKLSSIPVENFANEDTKLSVLRQESLNLLENYIKNEAKRKKLASDFTIVDGKTKLINGKPYKKANKKYKTVLKILNEEIKIKHADWMD